MTNSANPDQLASSEATDLDLHCLQKQGICSFSRTTVKLTEIALIRQQNAQGDLGLCRAHIIHTVSKVVSDQFYTSKVAIFLQSNTKAVSVKIQLGVN